MKLLSKKETLKQTIPLMALMIGLNVVLNICATYIPFAGYIFILFMPLVSTIFCLNSKKRYFPIYFVSTILISVLTTLSDFSSTLLYLLPSLVSGFIFSFCINKNINFHFAFLLNTLVLFIAQIAFIPLIDFIYSIHTINNVLILFGLNDSTIFKIFILAIIYFICAIEITLVYIVTSDELSKFGYFFNNSKIDVFVQIYALMCSLFAIIFNFLNIENISILFIVLSLNASIFTSIELINNKIKSSYFIIPLVVISSWLIYVFLISKTTEIKSTICFTLIPIILSITSLIYIISDRIKKQRKANNV